MIVLGIESSCDDTSAAVVADGRKVLSCVTFGQEAFHRKFSGVVPEIASRRHMEAIEPTVRSALEEAGISAKDLDGLAVTSGPGLVGSILVGLAFGKALAFSLGIPFVGVDHVRAHLAAALLADPPAEFPFIGLAVSGGHTHLFLVKDIDDLGLIGRTLDDAAGECFDKIAKALGLGYPGGPAIERFAEGADSKAFKLPKPKLHDGTLDFSFSGLKTATLNQMKNLPRPIPEPTAKNLAASFQQAIVDVLVSKLLDAVKKTALNRVVVAGGVAANRTLYLNMAAAAKKADINLFFAPTAYCTDNAAMVAVAGSRLLEKGKTSDLGLNSYANLQQNTP